MERNDVRGLLTRLHREQARSVAHPSPRALDDYERALTTREDAVDYVKYLLLRSSTGHPSPWMTHRAERMVRRIERHDALRQADRLSAGADDQQTDDNTDSRSTT